MTLSDADFSITFNVSLLCIKIRMHSITLYFFRCHFYLIQLQSIIVIVTFDSGGIDLFYFLFSCHQFLILLPRGLQIARCDGTSIAPMILTRLVSKWKLVSRKFLCCLYTKGSILFFFIILTTCSSTWD